MIVNYKQSGWEVITQRAHGLLAVQVAMQWNSKQRPVRWIETLLAIAEHDDAEVELDGENLVTESGGPLTFSMKKFDFEHCQKLAMLSITKSRYIALLTSMHMDFLHQKEEKDREEVQQFLQEQRMLQEKWRSELAIDEKEAKRVYYLMEWCDAFSLILCQRHIQPEKRGIEISTGPDGTVYQLFELEKSSLTVDPWPFEANDFRVSFESRDIKQLNFKDSAEFRKAFIDAEVSENVLTLVRQKGKITKPKKV